ncbi:SURF1 family protein [Aquabacterium sp. A7-Y]|uniref:SURF1 family protein n=1 Tax=Aquabacterium sp. A7-Y TaxID=1349605 RepID=UPI00223DE0F6|nr:SURF1 family protein [Aquabacterium sp. A7-Y]MCW7537412.1 SURF1 family protein [Aquabacterium sp. A7-Y]
MTTFAARPAWRRRVVLLATVTGVALTASLGRWQLDRAAQKEALQAALQAQAGRPSVDLNSVEPEAAVAMHWRPATLRGEWLSEHTVFLDNRQMYGRPGFYVVTPLRPLGRQDAVLVQRGWVPRDVRDRTRLPSLVTPAGVVSVRGRIAPPPVKLYEFAGAASGPIRQNLDVSAFEGEIRTRLWPVSLVEVAPAGAAPDGLSRDWPQAAVDVHKHHGYAFQWFAMSALMTGLYVWFQLLRPRLHRAR